MNDSPFMMDHPSVSILLPYPWFGISISNNTLTAATGMYPACTTSSSRNKHGSGLPHYGHLLTSTIKDIIPRYWSMKGYHVVRRFGWDTHGVPIEYEIDKRLGMSGRDAVLQLGLEKYNSECRAIVMRYAKEWRQIIERLGRWIDFDNDYKV